MIIFEDRAATVLYQVLCKLNKVGKFLLPLNVCPIVPDTFIRANIDFDFIDISLDTLCMDEDLILNALHNDKSIDGVLFVKTFGTNLNSDSLYQKIKSINKDIFIIDDCCPCKQDFSYDIENSYADMALFSSGYSKYVDIGYGGFGYLKDDKFKDFFIDRSKDSVFLDYKAEIKKNIQLMQKHKAELNNIYRSKLPRDRQLGEKFNNWRFSLLVDDKETILKKIFATEGLFASSHYPQVDYNYTKNPIKNSNTKKIHDKIINLFNDFRFTKEQAFKTVEIINSCLDYSDQKKDKS